jgi:hypothetical protein
MRMCQVATMSCWEPYTTQSVPCSQITCETTPGMAGTFMVTVVVGDNDPVSSWGFTYMGEYTPSKKRTNGKRNRDDTTPVGNRRCQLRGGTVQARRGPGHDCTTCSGWAPRPLYNPPGEGLGSLPPFAPQLALAASPHPATLHLVLTVVLRVISVALVARA